MFRKLALVAVAAAALVLAPSAAMAYDAPSYSSTVTDSTPAVGQAITVTLIGGAANAGQQVQLVSTSTTGSSVASDIEIAGVKASAHKTAPASGTTTFTLTTAAAGTYTLQLFNTADALVSDQVIRVGTVTAAGTGAALSDTGFDGMGLAAGAGALLLAGAGAVFVAKRRQIARIPA